MDDYGLNYPRHDCELKKKRKKRPSTTFEKFKKIFLVSDKNFRGKWYLRTKGSVVIEMDRHVKSGYWYVVHPFSLSRLVWEWFMVGVFFFALVFVPFRGSFLNAFTARYNQRFKKSQDLIIAGLKLEFALNMIFILDSVGLFFTGHYFPETSYTELSPPELFKRHIRNFVVDFLLNIPLDSVILILCGIEVYENLSFSTFVWLQILNIIQLFRFKTYVVYCCFYRKFKVFSQMRVRLMTVFLVYFLTWHWTVYFVLVIPQIVNGENLYEKGSNDSSCWVQSWNLFKYSLPNQYCLAVLRALHFIHFESDEEWKNMYSLGDYFCGLLINVWLTIYRTFLVIYISEAIVANNALTMKLKFLLKQLKAYMKWRDIPRPLKKRLHRFYLHRFQAHFFSNKAILGKLTESLRKEIGLYTSHRLIHNTDLFQMIPKNTMARFVQKMHRELYFPNDVIIQGNTFGESMYFICSGTVSVRTVNDKEICTLKDGDFFGEIALIVQNRRRTATVTAVTITEVYRLEASDFKLFIDEYPAVYTKLETIALERYRMVLVMERAKFVEEGSK